MSSTPSVGPMGQPHRGALGSFPRPDEDFCSRPPTLASSPARRYAPPLTGDCARCPYGDRVRRPDIGSKKTCGVEVLETESSRTVGLRRRAPWSRSPLMRWYDRIESGPALVGMVFVLVMAPSPRHTERSPTAGRGSGLGWTGRPAARSGPSCSARHRGGGCSTGHRGVTTIRGSRRWPIGAVNAGRATPDRAVGSCCRCPPRGDERPVGRCDRRSGRPHGADSAATAVAAPTVWPVSAAAGARL